MKLNLKRPIVFFDLETTGTDAYKDHIVELSYIKVYPDGREETNAMRFNPGVPIPQEASAVHGIYDKDVQDKPLFQDAARSIGDVFRGCDVAGFNSNKFDIPLLAEEFLRAGVNDVDLENSKKIDAQVIFHKHEPRTLSAAYKFYCNDDLENAHSALADTTATYEVLKAQLDKYTDIQNNVDFLSEYTTFSRNVDLAGRFVYNENNVEVVAFGKYRNQAVKDLLRTDPGYFNWMLQADFPLTTKQTIIKLKKKYLGQ